jgi:hypothetical protein
VPPEPEALSTTQHPEAKSIVAISAAATNMMTRALRAFLP